MVGLQFCWIKCLMFFHNNDKWLWSINYLWRRQVCTCDLLMICPLLCQEVRPKDWHSLRSWMHEQSGIADKFESHPQRSCFLYVKYDINCLVEISANNEKKLTEKIESKHSYLICGDTTCFLQFRVHLNPPKWEVSLTNMDCINFLSERLNSM